MKSAVFISWSGFSSKQIAGYLNDWLKNIFIQGLDIWMSDENIKAGTRWNHEVSQQLNNCSLGVICLTRDNTRSPWIMFESGALSKVVDSSKVIPYLFRISPSDIEFPLAQFQSVEATESGTWELVESINQSLEEPIETMRLRQQFEKWWPELERAISNIEAGSGGKGEAIRTDRELLEELLELTRRLSINERKIAESELARSSSRCSIEKNRSISDDKDNNFEDIYRRINSMFPALSKDNVWWIVAALSENDRSTAIARARRETGAKSGAINHLVNTIDGMIKASQHGQ